MQVFPLSEGSFTIGHDKVFTPFDENVDVLEERTTGSLLVEVQPFLIKTKHKLILIDTGLGFNKNNKLQLHQNIIDAGFSPNDVNQVFISHLHKDHAGGISFIENEMEQLSFPNATYFVHENEMNFAIEKGKPSYESQDYLFLKDQEQLVYFNGEKGKITNTVSFEMSGGHCPFHCCFSISENNETIYFAADIASQLKQLKVNYMAKYDFDGKKSMEYRSEIAEKGKAQNWTFLFYHDVKVPLAQL